MVYFELLELRHYFLIGNSKKVLAQIFYTAAGLLIGTVFSFQIRRVSKILKKLKSENETEGEIK
jgi:hypothetical protein